MNPAAAVGLGHIWDTAVASTPVPAADVFSKLVYWLYIVLVGKCRDMFFHPCIFVLFFFVFSQNWYGRCWVAHVTRRRAAAWWHRASSCTWLLRRCPLGLSTMLVMGTQMIKSRQRMGGKGVERERDGGRKHGQFGPKINFYASKRYAVVFLKYLLNCNGMTLNR